MSELRRHLRSRVNTLAADIRRGLAMRSEREWVDLKEARDAQRVSHEFDVPLWESSPRRRFHHGIRKRVEKLRIARRRLATLIALEEVAKGAQS